MLASAGVALHIPTKRLRYVVTASGWVVVFRFVETLYGTSFSVVAALTGGGFLLVFVLNLIWCLLLRSRRPE